MILRQLCGTGFLISLLTLLHPAVALVTTAHDLDGNQWIQIVPETGKPLWVPDARKPALYTSNFGDCLGASAINVTRFDAAFYRDNMTLLLHLEGTTGIDGENTMVYLGVYAYGETRFDLTFNPCSANINSLCPTKAGAPINAAGELGVLPEDIVGIPGIAYNIPDFEGIAVLRVFANDSQSEIGCFSAAITNGHSFSQVPIVGSVLGAFTVVAMVASFATAVYGDSVPEMRKHYAHSMSVLAVFAVFQHVFYSGALSMNWPSVLVAFWSNFAWAGGMVYNEHMQNTINSFIGSNLGNTTAVGAASPSSNNEDLGGGYDLGKIYQRDAFKIYKRDQWSPKVLNAEAALAKRAPASGPGDYGWHGSPVRPGLPLPGNYSGFAGTLSVENIPASNSFMTGFLWLLALLASVIAAVAGLKWALEGLARINVIRKDRLTYFRRHWIGYSALVALRTLFIAFFVMVFLSIFEFSYDSASRATGLAAVTFTILVFGMFGVAIYACLYRLRGGRFQPEPARIYLEKRKVLGLLPWYSFHRATGMLDAEKVFGGSLPFWRISSEDTASLEPVHEDEIYTKKFGWLASRFRRTRWWFFSVWLVYEFVRACFYAGASGHPVTQVFGLLSVEIIAFIAVIIIRPFEGQRLNAIVVYLLGFSKVLTVALSSAFDNRFHITRITTTIIGIVIIIVQSLLTIAVLLGIIVGAATSWMSITRHRSQQQFRPRHWIDLRERYLAHLDRAASDLPAPPRAARVPPDEPTTPYFAVSSVRRVAKIEDEDPALATAFASFSSPLEDDDTDDAPPHTPTSQRDSTCRLHGNDDAATPPSAAASPSRTARIRARASSTASSAQLRLQQMQQVTSLPHSARVHRRSWSARDFPDSHMPRAGSSVTSLVAWEDEARARARARASQRGSPVTRPRLVLDRVVSEY